MSGQNKIEGPKKVSLELTETEWKILFKILRERPVLENPDFWEIVVLLEGQFERWQSKDQKRRIVQGSEAFLYKVTDEILQELSEMSAIDLVNWLLANLSEENLSQIAVDLSSLSDREIGQFVGNLRGKIRREKTRRQLSSKAFWSIILEKVLEEAGIERGSEQYEQKLREGLDLLLQGQNDKLPLRKEKINGN